MSQYIAPRKPFTKRAQILDVYYKKMGGATHALKGKERPLANTLKDQTTLTWGDTFKDLKGGGDAGAAGGDGAAAAATPRATPKGLDETHYQADIADHEWEWDLDTGG